MENEPTYHERSVHHGEGTLHVRDYPGDAPAFVMMHGFPDNSHIYDDLIPYLVASGRRVVVFDFLGFGSSEKPSGSKYTFAQQLGDLKAVVDELVLGKIVPVTHDSSGAAGINFAIDHPELTAGLVVLNSAYSNAPGVKWPELIVMFATPGLSDLTKALLQSPQQFGWVVNFQRESFKSSLEDKHKARYESFLGPVIDANFRNPPSSAPAFAQMTSQFYEELTRNDGRIERLRAIDVPVKIIWGENDHYINVGVARDLQSHFGNASLDVVSAGHWLQIDEPEAVAKIMLS